MEIENTNERLLDLQRQYLDFLDDEVIFFKLFTLHFCFYFYIIYLR